MREPQNSSSSQASNQPVKSAKSHPSSSSQGPNHPANRMASPTLIDILSNEYLLLNTTPHLLPTELLALGLCSRSFHNLVTESRSVWRHLDLSLDPHPTPANASTSLIAQRTRAPLYKAQPDLLFSKRFVLRDVKTLVLDGLPVAVDVLHSLFQDPACKVQLLSIRGCTTINQPQLEQLFYYLARPSRERDLSLKGVYWFADMDSPNGGILPVWVRMGRTREKRGLYFAPTKFDKGWTQAVKACEGVIAFDSCLCTGPRHEGTQELACIRLDGARGCTDCGSTPEKRRQRGPPQKVLYPPVPLTTSDIVVACRGPESESESDILRCEGCMKDRWCVRCNSWWCEDCAIERKKYVSLDCYECGYLCAGCTEITSRTCNSCGGEYCVEHNTGADDNWCEWCNSPERRMREQTGTRVNDRFTLEQRTRTIERLNAIRSSFGAARFKDEAIVRNRCSLLTL